MKNNLRRLNAVSKMFDLDIFYSIDLWYGWVKLHASYSHELEAKLLKLKRFTREIRNDWIYFTKGKVLITLPYVDEN